MTMSAPAQAGTSKPVVVVAGVGPGIGTSVARAFGAEGFGIAMLARNAARLAARQAELTAAGITAAAFIVDLADAAATYNVVEQFVLGPAAIPRRSSTTRSRCKRVRLTSSTRQRSSAR